MNRRQPHFFIGILLCCTTWREIAAFLPYRLATPTFLKQASKLRHCPPKSHAATETAPPVELRTLYPPLAPYRNGTLVVDETHTLAYQVYGSQSPTALTALFLHGGPGAGCFPNHARFFDPDLYRIVLLDQRGSGKSTPRGEAFVNNTLLHLVTDCETLRKELEVAAWDVVLGGSWGTTLAIAYAQEFPTSVKALVLRGVCLLRPGEVDWLLNRYGGAAAMLDDQVWTNFSRAVGVEPKNDSGRDALHAHYDRLLGEDPNARLESAKAWMYYEMQVTAAARRLEEEKKNATSEDATVLVKRRSSWGYCDSQGTPLPEHQSALQAAQEPLTLRRGIVNRPSPEMGQFSPRPVPVMLPENTTVDERVASFIPAQAMLTCFYSVNSRYALNNLELLSKDRMDRIRSIPCIAVQGALDTICPPDTALDLSDAWPEMELRIPTLSGHSMYDEAITNELVRATDRMAKGSYC